MFDAGWKPGPLEMLVGLTIVCLFVLAVLVAAVMLTAACLHLWAGLPEWASYTLGSLLWGGIAVWAAKTA